MFLQLFLIFVLLPLADLLLIWMLIKVHVGITIIWILLSGLIGAWYVRRQGTNVMADMRGSLDQGQLPTNMLVEGGIVLFAGALLITPGLITDLLGFSMLFKPCRRWYRVRLVNWLKSRVKFQTFQVGGQQPHDPNVVDAEVKGRKSSPATEVDLDRESPIPTPDIPTVDQIGPTVD